MPSFQAFWTPVLALFETMVRPFETAPVLGILGWVGVLSAIAGFFLCVRTRRYEPLLVLAAVLPAYLGLVFLFGPGPRLSSNSHLAMSSTASVLSLAGIAFGFAKSSGVRTAAALMLPLNALFLFGLAFVTAIAVRR